MPTPPSAGAPVFIAALVVVAPWGAADEEDREELEAEREEDNA